MSHHVEVAGADDFLAVAALDRMAWDAGVSVADGEHTWRVWCEHATVLLVRWPKNPDPDPDPDHDGADPTPAVAAALVLFPTQAPDGGLFLHKIMVAPEWRGRGMGTALMAAAVARAQTPVMLTVAPGNQAAVGLYQRYGFAVERYIENYYGPHKHRYLMIYRPNGT